MVSFAVTIATSAGAWPTDSPPVLFARLGHPQMRQLPEPDEAGSVSASQITAGGLLKPEAATQTGRQGPSVTWMRIPT